MGAQALSGIAKDLTKMSSKSAVKFVAGDGEGALFRMVALLTGSKNALKGVGFFLGAALLAGVGYDAALWLMAGVLVVTLAVIATMLTGDIGKSKVKAPLRSILSKSEAINRLSAARFFLFASRDIWFVVALPIYLNDVLGWSFYGVGGFLAAWVIGYGAVQSLAPRFLGARDDIAAARNWSFALGVVATSIAIVVSADFSAGDHDGDDHRRTDRVRRRVRTQLVIALVSDPRLQQRRPGVDRCRVLLLGKRRRPPRRDVAVRSALPVGRALAGPLGHRPVRRHHLAPHPPPPPDR